MRWQFGEFEVDAGARVVRRAGVPVALQEKAFELLVLLVRRPGVVVTNAELYAELWPGDAVTEHSLRQATHRLRVALGDSGALLIQTVRGRGLRLSAEIQQDGRGQLPDWPTRFVGRQLELSEVRRLASEPGLVTLIGMGGIGKSRLAAEVLRVSTDPVWFCGLHDVYTLEAWFTEVAQTLGVLGAVDGGDSLGQVLAGRGRCTLVLDGVERLVDQIAPIVARWRGLAREATFLVTSRESLRLSGERWYRVCPMSQDDGLLLLSDRAALVSSEPLEPASGRALVDKLEGLPLAIELAAARLVAMSPGDLSVRLAGRLGWRGTSADVPARHATLEAVLAWSWELLEEGERSSIGQCAVFQGRFTLAAAEDVVVASEPVSALLVRLVNRSWLHVERDVSGATWYRMLDLVRDFVSARAGAQPEARLRAAQHFSALGQRSRIPLSLPSQMLADLVASLRYGQSHGRPEIVAGAALGATSTLFRHGPQATAVELLREALALCPDDPWLTCRLSVVLGDALGGAGALELADRGVELARASGDEEALCEALRVLALQLRARGDARALGLLRDSLALAMRLGDVRAEQQAWLELSRLHLQADQLEDAVTSAERVVTISEQHPPYWRAEYAARLVLASCAAHRRDAARARENLARARALGSGDLRARSVVERMAATISLDLGDPAAAAHHAELAMQHNEALGQPVIALFSALALAQACCSLGQLERADAILTRVVAGCMALGVPAVHASALILRAEYLEPKGAGRQGMLEEALRLARASGRPDAIREAEEALKE
jgi:predicted ATPase/DNA-binding winged helix-turn-helix (wHTH) protein